MKPYIETAISTSGRIFVAQLTRDLAKREIASAQLLAPGAKTWKDAFRAFGYALSKSGSPVKAAKMFHRGIDHLRASQKQSACFVNGYALRSRSGYFEAFTYEVSPHPLVATREQGIIVRQYTSQLQRNGRITVTYGSKLAFLSWHALARMHERSRVDIFQANGAVAACGIAGVLMRESDKHANTEINIAFEGMICTGVMRIAESEDEDSVRYGFYDVLTVLAPDEDRLAKKIEQGCAIASAVRTYIKADNSDPRGYGEKIPVIPFHGSDYVSRVAASA